MANYATIRDFYRDRDRFDEAGRMVDVNFSCPECGERDSDLLEMGEDDIRCTSCGTIYPEGN